ncbi:hypothetical protein [Reichenbachiella versicolor]|uniref:hypothetical protein n=1 Tax=Reichenbachiella versicolor TaxID=1821036 RepID=UPI000D6DEC7B|nr:hypothetical protein [Reichenbachiella versicolor]
MRKLTLWSLFVTLIYFSSCSGDESLGDGPSFSEDEKANTIKVRFTSDSYLPDDEGKRVIVATYSELGESTGSSTTRTLAESDIMFSYVESTLTDTTVVDIIPPAGTKPYHILSFVPDDPEWDLATDGLADGKYAAIMDEEYRDIDFYVEDMETSSATDLINDLDDYGDIERSVDVGITVNSKGNDLHEVTVTASNAMDNVETIERVVLVLDGDTVETFTTKPYTAFIQLKDADAGRYLLEAFAFNTVGYRGKDLHGTIDKDSDEIDSAPIPSIESYPSQITVGDSIYVTVAEGTNEISSVEFLIDGSSIGSDSNPTNQDIGSGLNDYYAIFWTPSGNADDVVEITAKATDSEGLSSVDKVNTVLTAAPDPAP